MRLLATILALASVVTVAQKATDPNMTRQQREATARLPPAAQQRQCLHGADEAPEQRMRVSNAIRTARLINSAEARLSTAGGGYLPLSELGNVNSPEGFAVSLTTDGASYAFAVKDTLDPCYFALFSDQIGVIYRAAALQ